MACKGASCLYKLVKNYSYSITKHVLSLYHIQTIHICVTFNFTNLPQIPNLSLPYHKSYKSNIYQIIMSEIEATVCLLQKYS